LRAGKLYRSNSLQFVVLIPLKTSAKQSSFFMQASLLHYIQLQFFLHASCRDVVDSVRKGLELYSQSLEFVYRPRPWHFWVACRYLTFCTFFGNPERRILQYVNNSYYNIYILMTVDWTVLLLTVIYLIVFVLVTPCSLACGYHLSIRI
jgi:hypothetical protein